MPSVLAIDIGSSAVRAAIVAPDGIAVQRSRTRRETGSGLRFDPIALWSDVAAVVRMLPEPARGAVSAIGIAGHVGAVVVDERFAPVGDAYGWANPEGIDDLRDALGDGLESALRVTGRPSLGGGPIATLLSLQRSDPWARARAAFLLSPKDFLLARLVRRPVTDYTSAAYYGASSIADRAWDAAILARLGLSAAMLPEQHASTELVGALTAEAAEAIGVAAGTPVAAGGPDGTVGAMAVAGSRVGAIVDVAGTTDVLVRVVAGAPDPGGRELHNPYALGDRWTVGGSTGMTGGAVAWWTGHLGLGTPGEAIAALQDEIEAIGPGSDGLRLMPWMSGSRYPRWRSEERGGLVGLDARHGPAHVVRAAFEGAAYSVRQAVDALAGSGGDRDAPVVLAGGAARSRWLAQLRADVLGRPVVVRRDPDVSLLGAGLIALVAIDALAEDEVDRVGAEGAEELRPSAATAGYERRYEQWLESAGTPA